MDRDFLCVSPRRDPTETRREGSEHSTAPLERDNNKCVTTREGSLGIYACANQCGDQMVRCLIRAQPIATALELYV